MPRSEFLLNLLTIAAAVALGVFTSFVFSIHHTVKLSVLKNGEYAYRKDGSWWRFSKQSSWQRCKEPVAAEVQEEIEVLVSDVSQNLAKLP